MRLGTVPFLKAVADVTGGNIKIQRKDYQQAGILPVIDQGQEEVAGYTDNIEAAFQGSLPVILFGDHTRIFKYVDKPFALGADGVKILAPRDGFDAKFIYYYLLSCDIPSRGYSRHFKFLKEQAIPVFVPSEQRRIVEILDEADQLRRLRREADAKAARILPVLFLKMFGDPVTNPKGWPRRELREFVKPISRKNPALKPDQPFQYLDIAGIDGNQGMVVESRTILGREAPSRARQEIKWRDVVVSTVRPYLRATALVPQFLDDEIASTGFCVLRSHNSFGFGWLYALTRQMWFTEQLNIRARGASYPAVTDTDIFSLIIPLPNDKNLLSAFDSLIADIQSLYEQAHRASDHIEKLFSLLLGRAFSGQLTAKWREVHIKGLLAEMEQQARLLNLPLPKEPETTT